ncbi:MAG: sigma-70 family RNA polymerase sigma factor [Flavobacteriales bacterium]
MAQTILHQWVRDYADGMHSWALHKTSDKQSAEDLVQETFLAATQSFSKFENRSQAKTWLYSILNNKIIDHHRKQFRQKTVSFETQTEKRGDAFMHHFFDENNEWNETQSPAEWNDGQENLLDNLDFLRALQQCMGKLPAQWGSALQLKYLEEKKGELICKELGITPTNFWQILHRAKLQLRKCVEQNWFQQ